MFDLLKLFAPRLLDVEAGAAVAAAEGRDGVRDERGGLAAAVVGTARVVVVASKVESELLERAEVGRTGRCRFRTSAATTG